MSILPVKSMLLCTGVDCWTRGSCRISQSSIWWPGAAVRDRATDVAGGLGSWKWCSYQQSAERWPAGRWSAGRRSEVWWSDERRSAEHESPDEGSVELLAWPWIHRLAAELQFGRFEPPLALMPRLSAWESWEVPLIFLESQQRLHFRSSVVSSMSVSILAREQGLIIIASGTVPECLHIILGRWNCWFYKHTFMR